ncbi:MAG: hypothetical protein K2J74_04045 [Muribaculaceae bacterium]|nr:hypothetical protein [Muribaculaceae bacterium]
MTKYLSFILPLFIGFAMTGCSDSDDIDSDGNFERIDIVLTQPEKDIALGQYDFPVKLLSTAYTTQGKKSTMVSPLSASMVLGMVANAIDSAGRGEILDVMNLKDNEELKTYNAYMQKLLNNLPDIDKRSKFMMSNAFHLANDGILSPSYNQILNDCYFAEIGRFKEFDISVVNNVNKWVNEKTKGGIPEILSENDVNDNSSKYLKTIWINALYFNGTWHQKFDKSKTEKVPFYQNYPDQSVSTTVDMMRGKGHIRKTYINETYNGDNEITTAILPYGNDSFIFTAILPPASNPDIQTTLNALTDRYWIVLDDICKDLNSPGNDNIYLPKIDITKENDLIPVFKNMGLSYLLDANWGASMYEALGYDSNLYLRIFRQNAVLNLDEKGSEIKVVTAASAWSSFGGGPSTATFDRPFIYFIRERSTGAVLLAGVYTTE